MKLMSKIIAYAAVALSASGIIAASQEGLIPSPTQKQEPIISAKADTPTEIVETTVVTLRESNDALAPTVTAVPDTEACDASSDLFRSKELNGVHFSAEQRDALVAAMCGMNVATIPIKGDEVRVFSETQRVYAGEAAVSVVREREGELNDEMVNLIKEEGYVVGDYHDIGEVFTSGVGQTGRFMNMSFKETYWEHRRRAEAMFPALDTYSDDLRIQIVSSVYRGGLSGSPKTVALIKEGKYKEAAYEFLNNQEYRISKKRGDGVHKRMERLSHALVSQSQLE